MSLYLYYLFRPDFMQAMMVMTAVFLLPLRRERHWGRRLFCAILVAFLVEGGLGMLNSQIYGQNGDLPVTAGSLLSLIVYMGAPLAASLLTFRLCAGLSWTDALYGMACAYAAQHMSFCVCTALWGEFYQGDTLSFWANWLVILVVGVVCYYAFARRLPRDGRYHAGRRKALFTAGMVLFIALVLNYAARLIEGFGESAEGSVVYSICMIYDLLSCLFILWLQTEQRREVALQSDVETERRLRRQLQEQYEFSKENIDIINQKCHDLKHQIAALRMVRDRREQDAGLEEIERSVLIYDAVSKTGNEVLDTVLTEKSLLCERDHISWTCMAQGKLLDFMSPVDIYTLFGNALDNAVEGSCTVRDMARRSVAVTVLNRHGAAFIQIENYFDGALTMENGLPRTTKADERSHGFGIKSIRSIAERYGGTMNISTEDGIFLLSVLIPIPVRPEADCGTHLV